MFGHCTYNYRSGRSEEVNFRVVLSLLISCFYRPIKQKAFLYSRPLTSSQFGVGAGSGNQKKGSSEMAQIRDAKANAPSNMRQDLQ